MKDSAKEVCSTCRLPKAQYTCGVCTEPVCRSCAQFLEETTFSFLPAIPEVLKHSFYCQQCHDQHVAPELDSYQETVERAKNVIVIWKSYRGFVPTLRKSKAAVKVADCEDRRQAVIRLAFLAAREGYNALLQAHVEHLKLRNHGHQKTSWSGIAWPAQVDESRLELEDSQNQVWERGW